MKRNLFDSLCVGIFALSQPISGIFTERCHHQQFLQVLADTKDCMASAEQFEGVCSVVEGRQRCLEERLSPCLTLSLTGKLIGEYRSIWRWEFEERYRQAADDERVAQFLDSCRTLLGVQADRNPLIPLLDVVSLDNACGCQERYQVRLDLRSCFERGRRLDWRNSSVSYICKNYRICLKPNFPICLSERDKSFILEQIKEDINKEVRLKAEIEDFPRLGCLQRCITGDKAPCSPTIISTTTTTKSSTTIASPTTTQRPTMRPQPPTWPPCHLRPINPTTSTTRQPPCYVEEPQTTQRPPCHLHTLTTQRTTTNKPTPRPSTKPPSRPTITRSTTKPTSRPIVRPTPTQTPIETSSSANPDCPCCHTTRPTETTPRPTSPLLRTTRRPTRRPPPCQSKTLRPRPRPIDRSTPRPIDLPTTRRPPCQRKRKSKELRPKEATTLGYQAEEIQLSDKQDSDATQQAFTQTFHSSSSSSPILVLKENTSPARVPAASLSSNEGAEPVASSLTEKRQLGPSSGLAPGLCRTSDCGLSAGPRVILNVQMFVSLLVSLFLLLKDNLVE